MVANVEDDQLMRLSPTKSRKSKNTSNVLAVRIDPRGKRDNCNTMYSRESHIMVEAPSASSSVITRTSSAPTRPSTKPTQAA